MRIIEIQNELLSEEAIELTVNTFLKGGIVIFPTETVYGIGAVFDDEKAVDKLYTLKCRQKSKPFTWHIGKNLDAIFRNFSLKNAKILSLIYKKFWPGPFTIIIPDNLNEFVGLRMPDAPFILEVLTRLNKPVLASSANRASAPPPAKFNEIDKKLLSEVDLAINGGDCSFCFSSTIVKVEEKNLMLIRKGPIEFKEIKSYLKM